MAHPGGLAVPAPPGKATSSVILFDGKQFKKVNEDEEIAKGSIVRWAGDEHFTINMFNETIGKVPRNLSDNRSFYNPIEKDSFSNSDN